MDTPGHYTCICSNGYTGDGFFCEGIICPCLCPNLRSSYSIVFLFYGNFSSNRYLSMLIMHPFSDENECGPDGTNDCHQNANCTNTIGSYICTCNTGYSGDGKLCEGRNHNLMEEISRSSHLFLQIWMSVRIVHSTDAVWVQSAAILMGAMSVRVSEDSLEMDTPVVRRRGVDNFPQIGGLVIE